MTEEKRIGRPVEGITESKAKYYYWKIDSWIKTGNFAKWLVDPESALEAEAAFEKIIVSRKSTVKLLNQWREDWLSQEGWQRLQANVRQKIYAQGIRLSPKEARKERKKTVSLNASTATDLKAFADEQGISMDEAVSFLLENRPKTKRKK